ncbi:hypothetical protein CKA38_08530 [Ereboglobus luteus]|uniref:Uncharacterized protein n=2 Tax=Ereboglobus luteus TaxID=1796921 RepID=A0A2U8E334_9BACT|nr:hypothetical protein CKA38_08530 [Ereboglobus luteus]
MFAGAMLAGSPKNAPAQEPSFTKVKALPFPDVDIKQVSLDLDQIEKQTVLLCQKLGNYPPNIKDDEDRQATYRQWAYLVPEARLHNRVSGGNERTTLLLIQLYRYGHNLDVAQSGSEAAILLEAALKQYTRSIPINWEASYFYLQTNPENAPKGEAALLKLRELLGTDKNLDVERGLVFAYIYMQQTDNLIKQVDHCLALAPNDKMLRDIKNAALNGRLFTKKPILPKLRSRMKKTRQCRIVRTKTHGLKIFIAPATPGRSPPFGIIFAGKRYWKIRRAVCR